MTRTPDVPAERERDELRYWALKQRQLLLRPGHDPDLVISDAPLRPAPETREPDGWITIYDDLSREVVLDRVRAEAQAAQGYRVRPFVYLGAPAEATERSES